MLTRWNPTNEVLSLREAMDRLFQESFVPSFATGIFGGSFGGGGNWLPLDVYETPDEVVVKAAVPGLKPDDLNIQVLGDTVTISGQWQSGATGANGNGDRQQNYLLREHPYGQFTRTVTLPVTVNPDRADANFENGILTLTLPKAEEARPKSIPIKAR